MRITYRRKGGLLALLVLAGAALVGTVLLVTAVAALAIVTFTLGAFVLVARAFGWTRWRRAAVPAPFDGETIEGTVVASDPPDRT